MSHVLAHEKTLDTRFRGYDDETSRGLFTLKEKK